MTAPDIIAPALTITLFGPMQVGVQGQFLPPLRSRKSLWLLALLTLRHDRPVEREWLAGTLWADYDQGQANASLRAVLNDLRRALGSQEQRLTSPSRHTLFLELAAPEVEVDLLRFDAALKSGTLSELERAVALYRGPLLEGCTEEWVFQERNAREHNCLQALQKLGDTALIGGDHEQAVRYYQRAVGVDAWWEAARRGWMEALAKSGDINAALQVYREFVEFLRRDPTATPDEQTSALYQRLRAEVRQRGRSPTVAVAQETAVPTVSGYLPHPRTDLIGREDECLEVAARLDRSRLVTLTGFGGIGKTRLALAIAARVVRKYADGVWLVALESLSEGGLVVPQIASALGLREEPGRPLLESVTAHLRNKRLLLVLDNCEHLLQASAQVVVHLLRECAEVRVLATSREAFGITGETAWSVPSLAVPALGQLPAESPALLQAVMDYESVQLFVERAQAVQKSFNLTGSNALAVVKACHQLEGIPLAIELVAARARAMTVELIVSRLENHLGLLTGGGRTVLSRQQTLRATLDWSYALLSEAERSLLRRLSVFAGGCLLEAAEQVCSGAGIEAGQALDLLASLVDKSLVVFEEREGAGGRYRLLEMVRQYAAEGLQASGEAEPIKTRHRDWYLALAEAAEPQLQGAEQAGWLQRLETEHDNLRVALAFSETEALGAEAGLRLAGALYRFWNVRGDFHEGRAYLRKALEREGAQATTAARAKALNGAGDLACRQGDYTSARALNEEALTMQRALGDRGGIAVSLNNLWSVAYVLGDYDAATTLIEESLVIRRQLGDKAGIANSLDALAYAAYTQDDNGVATTLYEESLAIRRELADKGGIAVSLNNLGMVANAKGDKDAVRTLFEESLALYRELGDRARIAYLLHSLGFAVYFPDDYDTARMLLQESLTLFREMGHSYIIHALGALGHVEREAGDYAQATALYQESLRLRWEMGNVLTTASSLEDFAGLAGRQGQWERAARLLGAAETLCATLGRTSPVGIVAEYERTVAAARAALSEEAFAAAWEEGRTMTMEQAVAYALEVCRLREQPIEEECNTL